MSTDTMRLLSQEEVDQISGGLSFTEGGLAIIGVSLCSPVTAPLALIGVACLYVGYYQT